jgi:serine/threonine protein kinase
LRHVHQHNYYHLDVSLENVLLSKDRSIAKLCDFGQARTFQTFKSSTETIRPGKILPQRLQTMILKFVEFQLICTLWE